MVAAYKVLYMGAYTTGIRASATPNKEFTFPSSSLETNLVAIERIAIKEVPLKISTTAPRYMCQGTVAKAYTKPDKILEVLDKTPIRASSILHLCDKTPTQNNTPEIWFWFISSFYCNS